jgi:hypothetical protein
MDVFEGQEKLDPPLRELVRQQSSERIPVIVQTIDGLKDDDRLVVERLGGKVKDDLYIINAFSAELGVGAIESLVLSPRVTKIYFDAPVRPQ